MRGPAGLGCRVAYRAYVTADVAAHKYFSTKPVLNSTRRHGKGERSVLLFAAFIVANGIFGVVTENWRAAVPALAIGVAMAVVTEWVVWRR